MINFAFFVKIFRENQFVISRKCSLVMCIFASSLCENVFANTSRKCENEIFSSILYRIPVLNRNHNNSLESYCVRLCVGNDYNYFVDIFNFTLFFLYITEILEKSGCISI